MKKIIKLSFSNIRGIRSNFVECESLLGPNSPDILIEYQVKPHPPPWCSAGCAAVIAYKNYFFYLYQQNKSSESKVKFRKASNRCRRVLEAAKLTYANKTEA